MGTEPNGKGPFKNGSMHGKCDVMCNWTSKLSNVQFFLYIKFRRVGSRFRAYHARGTQVLEYDRAALAG
jgi:hypothetical protein